VSKRCKYCKKIIGICNYPIHDDCKDAYEQGKLAERKEITDIWGEFKNDEESASFEIVDRFHKWLLLRNERLKSQLKEVKKDV